MTTVKKIFGFAVVGVAVIAAVEAGAFPLVLESSKDNTLYEYEATIGDVSNGQGSHMFAGRTGVTTAGKKRRALVAFDLGGLPGGTVNSVTLTLNMSKTLTGPSSISLHRVLADWGEGSSDPLGEEGGGIAATLGDATWRHRFFATTFWTTQGGDFETAASATTSVNAVGLYSWNSPQMLTDVLDWLANPATNFGWLLLGDETSAPTTKRFDTRENSDPSARPHLMLDITPLEPLDHFLCYKGKNSPRSQKFAARNVTLTDQLMAKTTWQVFKPTSFCTPTDKNGEGIFDEETHLEEYQLKTLLETVVPSPRTINVFNQFHETQPLVVTTIKLDRLLVPTAKCVDNPPGSCPNPLPAPDFAAHMVDHYACYKVKVKKGAQPFQAITNVPVSDQFTNPAKLIDLKKPTHLCIAADKNDADIKRPLFNLMCYLAKKAREQLPFAKQQNLHVSNQFGEEQINTIKEDELCVPSSIIVQ
jgi:hypothetical protein